MCGIAGIFDIKGSSERYRKIALTMARQLRHRGPDWSGIYSDDHCVLAHERLSIVDVDHGAQPGAAKSACGCISDEFQQAGVSLDEAEQLSANYDHGPQFASVVGSRPNLKSTLSSCLL